MNPETMQCALGHSLQSRYSRCAYDVDDAISRAVNETAGRIEAAVPRAPRTKKNCRARSTNFQIADRLIFCRLCRTLHPSGEYADFVSAFDGERALRSAHRT